MALKGVSVIELAGLAPAPFCGMILAEFGASVVHIDKVQSGMDVDCLTNGKRSLLLDIKTKEGVNILKTLSSKADVLIEPFRPGVMEKLGIGPKTLMSENNKLIYARLSGFGQNHIWSQRVGHDINFVGLSGLLSIIGGSGRVPTPPGNFAADFAGGGLMCALGIVMALFERSRSGLGQVIDANMTSGAAYAGSWFFRSKLLHIWDGPRGTNLLDGGFHFYGCYETKDSKFMAVGAIEPHFYQRFIEGLGLDIDKHPQYPEDVKKAKSQIEDIFKMHSQQHWIEVFKDVDACVTPVLDVEEAAEVNGGGYCRGGGADTEEIVAPLPAPSLSRTPARTSWTQPRTQPGQHTLDILTQAGYSQSDIHRFIQTGVVLAHSKL